MVNKTEKESKDEELKRVRELMESKSKDLKRVCKELNENMSDEELNEMIVRADSDRDGKVTFEDFYAIMTKKI